MTDHVLIDSKDFPELAAWHSEYRRAVVEAAAAKERLDAIESRLKTFLAAYAAGHEASKITLTTADVEPLRLRWKTRTSIDSKRLRADMPDVAERYSKTTGYWSW